ncbi:MAG: hypothetical protein AAFQ24_00175 [Pseudomonadota bacterium]
MQSFLTILLAGIATFFAFAMMPADPEIDNEILAEADPPIIVAETTATPVFVIERVEPLVLALDDPMTLEAFADFEFDSLGVEID